MLTVTLDSQDWNFRITAADSKGPLFQSRGAGVFITGTSAILTLGNFSKIPDRADSSETIDSVDVKLDGLREMRAEAQPRLIVEFQDIALRPKQTTTGSGARFK
jgi:hypothetical protein